MPVHPELARIWERLPVMRRLVDGDLAGQRVEMHDVLAKVAPPAEPNVVTEQRTIAGGDGQPLDVRIYRNVSTRDEAEASPAAVWFHGGAFVLGDLETEDPYCQMIASRIGAVVVSVDYRLAPEHPFPAGVEDCYQAFLWTSEHAAELGVDRARVAVGGNSAGGGLAAAVCLMARDRGGPSIAYQHLGVPVLDDRCDSWSMAERTDPRVWSAQSVRDMWDLYLGPDRSDASPYAAPARAIDLSGLPPAYVLTNELDPSADEAIEYATRLMRAGVLTEIHNVPGAWHGFAIYTPRLVLSQRTNDRWVEAMAAALCQRPPETSSARPGISRPASVR